ncbi:MFS transporter [Rothia nasimurium]|uniref:MFS transporter n=1 Tax=Rothia nasimurium TaxID=85336 RepID=UPI001F016414|nr:MFS transporter [Rothia nasimurium]
MNTHQQRRILWALALTQVFGTIGVGAAPSVGVLLASEVTQNEALAGIARTASTFGAALFGVPLAQLAARTSRRTALTTGWATATLGAAILAWAASGTSMILVALGLLLMGAGSAAALQARFAATDHAADAKRGSALSFIVWVGTIGSVLGPNIGTPAAALAPSLGTTLYSAAFALAALALGVATLLVFALLPGTKKDAAPGLSTAEQGAGASGQNKPSLGAKVGAFSREIAGNRQARYAAISLLGAHMVMVSVMTMTPVHMNHQGSGIEIIGLTISLHVLGMYGLSPLMGLGADRLGERTIILLGTALLVLAVALGALAPHNIPAMVASLILLGVGWSATFVAASALFAASLPAESRTRAAGGLDSLTNLGAATAALASGFIMAATSFSTLACIAALALVPSLVLTRPLRERGSGSR